MLSPATRREHTVPQRNTVATPITVADLITPERVVFKLRAGTKASVLQQLAQRAADELHVNAQQLADLLAAREGLGSTGLGHGIAVPHTMVKGAPNFFALLVRLDKAIDFAAIDGLPVDILVLLLTPENAGKAHLSALAAISRRLRDATVVNALRTARDAKQMYDHFVGQSPPAAPRNA